MKESQDNFRDIDNKENDQNINDANTEETYSGIDDNKIREEGGQDNTKEYEVQEEEPCGQVQDAWQKAQEDTLKEEAVAKEEITADKEREAVDKNLNKDSGDGVKHNSAGAQQYSCSYQPPYYVPDFTEGASKSRSSEKERKGLGVGVLAAVLVLAIVLSVLGGAFGYVVVNKINRDGDVEQQAALLAAVLLDALDDLIALLPEPDHLDDLLGRMLQVAVQNDAAVAPCLLKPGEHRRCS